MVCLLKSSPSGFFYPSNIQKTGSDSNTIQIDYSFFAGSQPSLNEQTITNGAITEPGYTIKTTLNLSEDTNFYNQSDFIEAGKWSNAITVLKNDDNLVIPKVFAYLCDSDTETVLEEIYVDNLFTITDEIIDRADNITGETTSETITKITIHNPTTLTKIKYIMR